MIDADEVSAVFGIAKCIRLSGGFQFEETPQSFHCASTNQPVAYPEFAHKQSAFYNKVNSPQVYVSKFLV